MNEVITIGVDLAKNVFQVHGVDAEGAVIVRRRLKRGQVLPFFKKQSPCLVGMEACATSHHWGREIEALGHQVRLMPPRYVKPYVKRTKARHGGKGAGCSPSIRRRISANRARAMATSASWNVTYRPWLTPMAPILTSFSRSAVGD